MDHSTNPISSDLYKFRFKHSVKRWPHGRFCHYKEQMEKSEGSIMPINCMRTFPLQPKRKKVEQKQPDESTSSTISVVHSIAPDKKKKLADEQTDFYAKFFASNKTYPVNFSTISFLFYAFLLFI